MGLTERLAYILSVDVGSGTTGFGRLAASAENAALAQARMATAAQKVAVEEAAAAQRAAKAAGDTEALAAATEALAAARARLAEAKGAERLVGAQGELQAAEKGLAGVAQQSSVAGRAMQQFGVAGASGSLVAGAAVTAAAGAILKFEKDSVGAFVHLVDAERQYRLAAGGTTEENSRMVASFEALGVPVDDASKAIFRLGKNVAEHQAALEKLGVVVATNATGTTDLNKTLLNIVDAYQHTADQAQKNEIVQKAFGRGGQALIPILAATTDQIRQLGDAAAHRGAIVHAQDEADVKKLHVATRELGADFQAFEAQIGKAIVPALADMARGADKVVSTIDHLSGKINVLGTAARVGLGVSTLGLSELLIRLGHDDSSAASAVDQLTQSLKDQAAAADEATASDKANDAAVLAERNAILATVTAHQAVVDAKDAETAAQEKLTAAEDAGARKVKDVAAATDSLAKANHAVANAQEALNQAERNAPRDLEKSRLDLASATFALKDAKVAEKAATEKVSAKGEDAQKATIAREQAELALADAKDKVAALDKAGEPKTVLDARQALADATDAAATAQDRLNKAQAVDPSKEVAAATKDLDRAHQGVASAVLAEKDAQDQLKTKIDDGAAARGALIDDLDSITKLLKADGVDPKLIQLIEDAATAAKAAGLPDAIKQANDAAIGAGIVDAPPAVTGGAPATPRPGPPAPAPAMLRGDPWHVTNNNVTVNATTSADANDIASAIERRLASTMRVRVS